MTNIEMARRLNVPPSQVSSITNKLFHCGEVDRYSYDPYFYSRRKW